MNKDLIFSGYGIGIFKTESVYSIRYDHGDIVPKFREDAITEEEAVKAQLSEQDAYKVLLGVMKRNGI